MEWNHGVTYQQNSTEGELFIKLPNISFPFTDSGDLILAMGNQVHADPLGPLDPLAGCFLALGSGLGLVGTASARR